MSPGRFAPSTVLAVSALALAAGFAAANAAAEAAVPVQLVQTIPLPGIVGKFDHMAVDLKGERLFVPAETQRVIEIVDLRTGRVIHSIPGLAGDPRKMAYDASSKQFWVDLGSGRCLGFDGETYDLLRDLALSGPDEQAGPTREPDNGLYDPATQQFFIGNRGDKSKASCSVDIVDTKTGVLAESIRVNDRDPSSLALDPSTRRLYVTLAMSARVAVIDLDKHAVTDYWPITGGPAPHAMAMDVAHHRLFIGSRVKPGHLYKPGKMVVMDADTGRVIQALDSEGGADEVAYDPNSGCVYLTGASGALDVYQQIDPDHYRLLQIVPTGAIAKSSLLVPELNRLYVAVPKHVILTPPTPESEEAVVEDAKILVFAVP